jgi:hypothetical protein
VQCTHLLRCWPLAMQPPRPVPRTLLVGWERTPQRLARIPLQPPLCWVHPHPRSSPWISCRVHKWLSTKYDYQIKCTTRERSLLKGSTGLLSWLGREDAGDVDQSSLGRCLLLGLSRRWLFSTSHGWFSAPLSNWGLARQLRHMFFHGGGWAAAGSSWLSHRIPIAFVPLFYGLGRRNLLRAMEFHRQHTQHRDISTRLPYSRKLTS